MIKNFLGKALWTATKFMKSGIAQTRNYASYQNYTAHQKEKTLDPERILKWQQEEWNEKIQGFAEIFKRNSEFLNLTEKAICLGSRTGQEVAALRKLGMDAIGIDLVSFPPYTIPGDIHDLNFEEETFGFAFSNIFDHALYPRKFIEEVERVLKSKGIFILHLQVGKFGDKYTETVVYDSEAVIELFHSSEIIKSQKISNSFDMMNWEIIAVKR